MYVYVYVWDVWQGQLVSNLVLPVEEYGGLLLLLLLPWNVGIWLARGAGQSFASLACVRVRGQGAQDASWNTDGSETHNDRAVTRILRRPLSRPGPALQWARGGLFDGVLVRQFFAHWEDV